MHWTTAPSFTRIWVPEFDDYVSHIVPINDLAHFFGLLWMEDPSMIAERYLIIVLQWKYVKLFISRPSVDFSVAL